MQEREEFIVDGFQFSSIKDVETAKNELDKIRLLESRMDYDNPIQVCMIYDKAIQNRVFKTPIGYTYLHSLQKYLQENPVEGKEIRSIPLFMNYTNAMREAASPARQRIKPQAPKKEPAEVRLRKSIIVNAALIIAVVVMFIITLASENPNILNYENAIVNKYSAWEQQLTEREKIVREKEKAFELSE